MHSAAISQCWGVKVVLRWVGLGCCWLRKCIFFVVVVSISLEWFWTISFLK